jgi:hypothetical protein
MKQTQVIDPIRHKAANPRGPSPEAEWAFWLVILSVELRGLEPLTPSLRTHRIAVTQACMSSDLC